MKNNNVSQQIKYALQQLIPNIVVGSFQLTELILNQIPHDQQDKLKIYENKWIVVFAVPVTDEGLWVWHSMDGTCSLFANLLLEQAAQNSINVLREMKIFAISVSDIVGQNISMVELGVFAGLGQKGRHNLLVHAKHGAWLQLNAIIVSSAVFFNREHFDKICIECDYCIDACPVNALALDSFEAYKCSMVVASPTKRKSKAKALTFHCYIECNECISACPIGKPPEEIYEWRQA